MVKMLVVFLFMFALFFVGIPVIRKMTSTEKLTLVKTLLYSLLCAALAVTTLSVIVFLF